MDHGVYKKKMNTQEYISIQGANSDKIIEAVQIMSNRYPDDESSKGIEIFQSVEDQNSFILNFTNKPEFEIFKCYVNYLNYPEVDNYKANVRGFWTIDDSDDLSQNHLNQRVMLYIPDSDDEYDNVYMSFANGMSSYKYGFAVSHGYRTLDRTELKFDEPTINSLEFNLIKTIQPDPNASNSSVPGCLVILPFLIAILTFTIFLTSCRTQNKYFEPVGIIDKTDEYIKNEVNWISLKNKESVDGYTRIDNSIFGGEIACNVEPLKGI